MPRGPFAVLAAVVATLMLATEAMWQLVAGTALDDLAERWARKASH